MKAIGHFLVKFRKLFFFSEVLRRPEEIGLDELANNGVSFDNIYTPSPICLPARMSLLTGKYPYKQECWMNSDSLASDIPTMAHSLGSVGYYPTLIGRLHSIGPDQMHGFASRKVFDHSSDWYGGPEYSLGVLDLSLIHISEPTRLLSIS